MTGMAEELTLVFIGAIGIFIYLGWLHRTTQPDEYHTYNRRAGSIRTTASLLTVVGAPHYAVMTTLAFLFGYWPISFYLGSCIGFLILGILSERIRSFAATDAHTFAEVAAINVGRGAAASLSAVGMVFLLGVVIAQVILGAQLLSDLSGLTFSWATVAVVVGVAGYLVWGGYRALLYTDVIQAAMTLVLTTVLVWYLWENVVGIGLSEAFGEPGAPLTPMIPMLFASGFLIELGAPQNWQRILTAKSARVAKRSLVINGGMMLLLGSIIVVAGNFIAVALPDAAPGTAFVDLVTTQLPAWMTGVVLVLLVVALLSTADSALFAAVVMGQKEYWRRVRLSDRPLEINISRGLIIGFSIIVLVGSLSLANLVDAWGVLVNLGLVMGPLAIAVLLERGGRDRRKRWLSFAFAMSLALVSFGLIWWRIGDFFTWWALAIVAFASIPLCISGKGRNKLSDEEMNQ